MITGRLQTIDYSYIFATGYIAMMVDHPLPNAGVFAVRQGKPLAQNILKYLRKSRLIKHKPQQKYLNIIGVGDSSAIAIWGKRGFESPLFWYGKKYVDFSFVKQFK